MTYPDTPEENVTEDEATLEYTDEEGNETVQKDKLKQLREKLTVAEAAKKEALEELQRAKADFLNTKKRLSEQQVAAVARSEDAFVSALLPLADSFAMAMRDTQAWNAIDEAWRKGVEGINAQLQRILTDHGVVAIDPVGAEFNPEQHEAVGTKAHDGDTGMVVEVLQQGYQRNGTVLRPAKVVISE
jgi:molecular chaperone GrpE